MENYAETIQTALASEASTEARAAGAAACRSVLATLDPTPPQESASPVPANVMPQLLAMLGKMDLNQILDVAIERLRAVNSAQPNAKPIEPVRALSFHLVPIPPVTQSGK